MALTPLDLQTLFIKMNDVNRVQAHLKGAVSQEQAFEAKELINKELHKDNSVNASAQEGDMDNRIKDDMKGGEDTREKDSSDKEGGDDKEKKEREYIKDPNLGKHIDLVG